ncbi:S8 family serine peptidase [Nesterenkonia jeotgali]|uniref:Subtilisin family serine protease n=1 Tax=Nesterenkonia jeotgali TaxID=317018 RepID=A0A839FL57_9MICC|nr:S8 family serine peptidase [Nesterenkonia jeotgali]MBA8920165.1 subtilisin family serine protease [Nesterenkonia jeotgali]
MQAVEIGRAQEIGLTGAGVRVAVLDTGFDVGHPDFAGRSVTAESFIPGEGPEDVHGHGTHCLGSACGPWAPPSGRGFGVAPGVEIFSGKVLGADGSGSDASILAGIDWALANGCQIISMSLGADVREVHPPYVTAGRRALEQGSLLVAAAGNNAGRAAGDPGFVGAPANSPYVMAVAALDQGLRVADFSARSLPHDGGAVDIAAPGVDIYSSWPRPELHRSISGTSMAAPHVSGVAALLSASTGLRGQALWDELTRTARPLEGADVEDVGAGLAVVTPEEGR